MSLHVRCTYIMEVHRFHHIHVSERCEKLLPLRFGFGVDDTMNKLLLAYIVYKADDRRLYIEIVVF